MGARVYVRRGGQDLPPSRKGYIGVGTITTEPALMSKACIVHGGRRVRFADLAGDMIGAYHDDLPKLHLSERGDSDSSGYGEWICGVDWQWTADVDQPVTLQGLTATEQSKRGIAELKPGRNNVLLAALEARSPPAGSLDAAPPEQLNPVEVVDSSGQTWATQAYGDAVEKAAVDHVTKRLESRAGGEWIVTSVEKDNCGWDLEAFRSGEPLRRIEVKGTDCAKPAISLTRNEYDKAHEFGAAWELHVVTDALKPEARRLHAYTAATTLDVLPSAYSLEMPPQQ